MSVVLALLCVINLAGCIQVNVNQNTIKTLKDENGQLTWTFTEKNGEQFYSGQIDFVRQGETSSIDVATNNKRDVPFKMFEAYRQRRWTASFSTGSVVLSANGVQPSDDGTYTLSLAYTGASGNIVSSSGAVRLKVLVMPFYPAGTFTEGARTYNEGEKVTLKCEPDGSPKPIKIFWKKNGVPYMEKDTNDPNLIFQNANRSHAGKYTCEARNEAGAANKIPTTDLVIKFKPVNTKFNVTGVLVHDRPGSLRCTAEAFPEATYTIVGAGINRKSGSGEVSIPKVLISNHDNKVVKCTPSNEVGTGPTVELKLDVKVKPNILDGLPERMDAIEGKNYSLTCSASAKPAANIVWLKNGSPLRNSPQTFVVGRRTDNKFESRATLKLAPVKRQDNGIYGCKAENAYGFVTKTVRLSLLYTPEVTNKNAFRDQEVVIGSRVELNCIAIGNPETKYYIWRSQNGSVIQNKTDGRLEFSSVQSSDGGRLSCAGGSEIGEGKKEYINLFVRVPPQIIVRPVSMVSLNQSERLLLFCNASGVPKPKIQWSRGGILLPATGELLSIPDVQYTDKGTYTCTASNGIEPNATAQSVVTIYFRPVILTNTAAETIKGAESGAEVQIICRADALPLANLTWLHFPSGLPVNETHEDVVKISKIDDSVILMKLKARIGAKYWCYAYNNRGNASQLYEIRRKGTPAAPVLTEVRTYIHVERDRLSTVRVDVKWIPGYDGGQSVWYTVSYRKLDDGQFTKTEGINADCNCYTIKEGLEADKLYRFFVQAQNNDGPSNSSNIIERKTEAFYGRASVERFDNGKIVKLTILYARENVTRARVRYREPQEQAWTYRDIDLSKQSLVIEDLDPKKLYEFQVLWYVGEELQITSGGEAGEWSPTPGGRSSNSLSREEIIAIIAGVGGFLLVVILVLFLCLIRRRQKPKRDEAVVVMRRQAPGSASVDVVSRRSLIGSVEDDPFESAHYGSEEKKKGKTRDSYYLPGSEDLNTFSTENSARHSLNPAENSKAYQPYRFGKKSGYQSQDDSSGSEDETLRLKASAEQPLASDEDLSSEPGYARPEDVKGSRTRDDVGTRTKPKPNSNDVYAQVKKGNKNYPGTNGRGAPPPYRPRSTADAPRDLPPYLPDDQLDLDDPSAVPFDDPLPPPMPVLPNSRSVPDNMWNNPYPETPADSDSTLERHKSPSRTSLPGKPYINVHGKLVRPSSSGRLSSSAENFDDNERLSPEPEALSGKSRRVDLDNDEKNLVSYLV